MRLAVVFISSGSIELHGEGVTLFAQLVVHGDLLLVYACWDRVFIEDNIVGSGLVVGPVIRKRERERMNQKVLERMVWCAKQTV